VQGSRFARKRTNTSRSEGKAQDCFSKYDGMAMLQLKACTAAEAGGIFSLLEGSRCTILDDDFEFSKKCSGVEVVCSKQAAAELENMEVASVVIPDAGAHWRQSSGPTVAVTGGLSAASDFFTTWRDLDAQNAQVEALVQASGGVATLEVVGQTIQKRDMRIVRFRGAGYSPGGTRLFATYNMHAREWLTGMAGVYQIQELIEKVKQDPDYLAGTEVVVMPMANPDGFHHSTVSTRMHRKNMRLTSSLPSPESCPGVDLNRNWDAEWNTGGSSGQPCSDTFHGPNPASEPEIQVMAQVMDAAPTTVYLDIHAFSQLIISAYGYTTADNPRSAEYRAMGADIQSAIRSAIQWGNNWTEGPIAQTLYAASGSSVDYADKKGALGVCFELRPGQYAGGFAPPTSDILPGVQESYAGFLAALDYAKGKPVVPSPEPAPTPAPAVPTPAPAVPTPAPAVPTPAPAVPTPAPVVPTPTPGGCPAGTSTGPDFDGDCACNQGFACYEDGASGCTFSYTATYDFKSTTHFLPTCAGCECISR